MHIPPSHPLLFDAGTWYASGYYLDRGGTKIEVAGSFTVEHEAETWLTRSRLTLQKPVPRAYANDCVIVPFPEGRNTTSWRSRHSLFGQLVGSFTLVEDSILSGFSSHDGPYTGSEYLLRVFDSEYSSRGAVLQAGRRVASWRVELVKM